MGEGKPKAKQNKRKAGLRMSIRGHLLCGQKLYSLQQPMRLLWLHCTSKRCINSLNIYLLRTLHMSGWWTKDKQKVVHTLENTAVLLGKQKHDTDNAMGVKRKKKLICLNV